MAILLLRLVVPYLLALSFFARAFASPYVSAWRSPQPVGASIHGLAFADDANGWAVGDDGTVLRTTDGGASWQDLSRFPTVSIAFTDLLALGPDQLLATGDHGGLHRSNDGGASWFAVPHPAPGRLARMRRMPNGTIAAAGDSGRVLVSTDAGTTWSLVPGPGAAALHDTWWLDAQRGFVVGPSGAWRTIDGGASWSAFQGTSFGPWNSVQFVDALNGMAFSDFYIGRTSDGGSTWAWSFILGGLVYADRTIVLAPQHWITAARLEGAEMFETENGGTNWTRLPGLRANAVTSLVRLPGGRIVAASDAPDIVRSDDGGATWTDAIERPDGDSRASLDVVAARGPFVLASGQSAYDFGNWPLLRSADGGATWARVTPEPATAVYGLAWPGTSTALLGGPADVVRRSTDGGATWTSQPLTLGGLPSGQQVTRFCVVDSSIVYASSVGPAGSGGVFRSTDGGRSWQRRDAGMGTALKRGLSFVDGLVGWAGDGSGQTTFAWRTMDGGALWQPMPTTNLAGPIFWMHAIDAQTCLASMLGLAGIYRTTDAGQHWTSVLPVGVSHIDFDSPLHGFAVSDLLYETQDGGQTWSPVTMPMANPLAITCTADGFVAVGAQSRILVAHSPTLAVPGTGPAALQVSLAVAGGASGRIEFAYALPEGGEARLELFDTAGRRISTLARGRVAPGVTSRVTWAPDARIASGVYFARLASGTASASRRFVLLR